MFDHEAYTPYWIAMGGQDAMPVVVTCITTMVTDKATGLVLKPYVPHMCVYAESYF